MSLQESREKFEAQDIVKNLRSLAKALTKEDRSEADLTNEALKRQIKFNEEVNEPPTCFEIDNISIATLGNFSTLIGRAKGRKTFLSLMCAAAVLSGKYENITSPLENGKIIIFADKHDTKVEFCIADSSKLCNPQIYYRA